MYSINRTSTRLSLLRFGARLIGANAITLPPLSRIRFFQPNTVDRDTPITTFNSSYRPRSANHIAFNRLSISLFSG